MPHLTFLFEGSAKDAQKFAAKVFHADKTYFVLNGTSAANKVVTNALLTRGDLAISDLRNMIRFPFLWNGICLLLVQQ